MIPFPCNGIKTFKHVYLNQEEIMLKFDEQKQYASFEGALKKRSEIEKIVDQVWEKGFDNIFFIGIGGTYASSMQVVQHICLH